MCFVFPKRSILCIFNEAPNTTPPSCCENVIDITLMASANSYLKSELKYTLQCQFKVPCISSPVRLQNCIVQGPSGFGWYVHSCVSPG